MNEPYVEGCSLFMMMTALGHTQAATYLFNSGASIDVTQKDSFGRNVVWYAAYACDHDRTAILKAVLAQGTTPPAGMCVLVRWTSAFTTSAAARTAPSHRLATVCIEYGIKTPS